VKGGGPSGLASNKNCSKLHGVVTPNTTKNKDLVKTTIEETVIHYYNDFQSREGVSYLYSKNEYKPYQTGSFWRCRLKNSTKVRKLQPTHNLQ
jgi:hypothetical protein